MFRIIDRHADGSISVSTDPKYGVALPPAGTVRWIDLTEPDPQALSDLQHAFAFHPLAIADCAAYGRQSRADDYDDYLFVVSHAFTKGKDPLSIQIHEIHAFIGESYLVTVHDNPIPAHEQVWQLASTDPNVLVKGPAWTWLQSLQAMVEGCEPLVAALVEELDGIERDVMEAQQVIDLSTTFRIKRIAVAMRRVLRPLRDSLRTLLEFAEDPDPRIPSRATLYLQSLTDRVVRLAESVEEAREVATGIVSGFHAVQATKTNSVIFRLTIFSAVFLPLSFVVGFWGQNFTQMPYQETWALALMLASLILLPLATLLWIKHKWL